LDHGLGHGGTVFFQEIACFFQDARVRADDIQPEDAEGLRPINEVSKAKRRMS
jgi:hypothetical protein